MIRRGAVFILLSIILAFSSISAVSPQQDGPRQYFPETGHWVAGEFLAFYQRLPEADRERIFGLPITEALPDNLRQGYQVQFFERVRMDYDPNRPAGERVSLAPIGAFLYESSQPGVPAGFSVNTPMCRLFAETGKYVCYAFLQLYDRLDGASLFGQPISNAEFMDDRLVQYFENVRMEWRAEMPEHHRVVLTEIGRIDFDHRMGSGELLRPVPIPELRLKEMTVRVFVNRPLVKSGDVQQVFVLAHNQYMEPLEGVESTVTLTYAGGEKFTYRLQQQTNAHGFARADIVIENGKPNQEVTVIAEAELPDGPSGRGSTWFRIWW